MRRRSGGGHCDVDAVHWSRFIDGEFSSTKCRECEVHLQHCAACRARLRDVRRTVRAMKAAGRQPLPGEVKAAMRRRATALVRGG
jgi:anti-sigma factor RsiW